jgi:hypothetical protein
VTVFPGTTTEPSAPLRRSPAIPLQPSAVAETSDTVPVPDGPRATIETVNSPPLSRAPQAAAPTETSAE